MQRFRPLLTMLLVLVSSLALAPSAHACSFTAPDRRDQFADADGAIVGIVLERHDAPEPPDEYHTVVYTIDVTESYKGTFDDTVEVYSAPDPAACGIGAEIGSEVGLYLDRPDQIWLADLIDQDSPDGVRSAAAPLPTPDGEGPVALLMGGGFGDQRVIALDDEGRTLGYGAGDDVVTELSICPGSARAVEIVDRFPEYSLAIRDVASLEIVTESVMPLRSDEYPERVFCARRDAGEVYVLTEYYGKPDRLLRIKGSSIVSIRRGNVRSAAFSVDHAYLSAGKRGREIRDFDLGTRSETNLVGLTGRIGTLSLSPDESNLALTAHDGSGTRTIRIDLRPRVKTFAAFVGANAFGDMHWMSNRRILFVPYSGGPNAGRIYNRRLEVIGRFGPWYSEAYTTVGQRLFGVSFGRLGAVGLPGGEVEDVAMMPTVVTWSLVAVPEEVFLQQRA